MYAVSIVTGIEFKIINDHLQGNLYRCKNVTVFHFKSYAFYSQKWVGIAEEKINELIGLTIH